MPKKTENRVDNYIPGVYNYCDRWCEACPLSHRCMVYAMEARLGEGAPLLPPSPPIPPRASPGAFAPDWDAGDASPAETAREAARAQQEDSVARNDRKSTRLNSSH